MYVYIFYLNYVFLENRIARRFYISFGCAHCSVEFTSQRLNFTKNMTNRGKICADLQISNRIRYVSASGETSHRGYSFQTRTFSIRQRITDRGRKNTMHTLDASVCDGTCTYTRVYVSYASIGSVLVIAGWENMAREISDSGFMRARPSGEYQF